MQALDESESISMGVIAGIFSTDSEIPDHLHAHHVLDEMLSVAGFPELTGRSLHFAKCGAIACVADGLDPTCMTSNEDGSIWAASIGNVHDYALHGAGLRNLGHRLRSQNPLEVLVHLYEDHRDGPLQTVRGEYALAIMDLPNQRLTLAVDELGSETLYHTLLDGVVVFASYLKGILAFPGSIREADPRSLCDFFTFGEIVGSKTLLKNIYRLEPGCSVSYQRGSVRPAKPVLPDSIRDLEQDTLATEMLQENLVEAVRKRSRSLGSPYFAYLSGGLDSTATVHAIRMTTKEPIKTLSVRFKRGAAETQYALRVSGILSTDHYEEEVGPDDFMEALLSTIWCSEEIKVSDNSVGFWLAARLARKHHTDVVFSSSGADEIFAGYDSYRQERLSSIACSLLRGRRVEVEDIRQFIAFLQPRRPGARSTQFVDRSTLYPWMTGLRYYLAKAIAPSLARKLERSLTRREMKKLFSARLWGTVSSYDPFRELDRILDHQDHFERHAQYRIKVKLPRLLRIEKECHRKFHVKVLFPFLDQDVVDGALRISPRLLVKEGESKHVLRSLLRSLGFPSMITDRPKVGFCVPIDSYYKTELRPFVENCLLGPRTTIRGYFRPQYVEKILEEHFAGLKDWTALIGALVNLELWCRMFIDGSFDLCGFDLRGIAGPAESIAR